ALKNNCIAKLEARTNPAWAFVMTNSLRSEEAQIISEASSFAADAPSALGALVASQREGGGLRKPMAPSLLSSTDPGLEVLLRSSLARLEARVRALEGQGVRSDRRAAELAGLAQALTEEQRTVLIRLDRLEEQMKPWQQKEAQAPEERLSRLEREQRAAALELRHEGRLPNGSSSDSVSWKVAWRKRWSPASVPGKQQRDRSQGHRWSQSRWQSTCEA
ncbi:unnamed protein product, partial [Symbiodinium pilosum]